MAEAILTKNKHIALYFFALLIGFSIFHINNINDTGYWPDSISYISASEHLLSGKGFVQYDGTPFVEWPPLFAVLLALIKLII